MHLLLLFLTLKQMALADDLPSVSAFVGSSVTLPSGADPSWELSSITWSIWANTTGIATYFSNTTNFNHIHKYAGRLHLNTRTGDLNITNVTSGDEMEYTVDFFNTKRENKVNKIKLKIKQLLSKPTVIRTRMSPGADSCLFGLHCSSPDAGVTLSWQRDSDFQSSAEINNELIVILNKTQSSVKFSCVSRKNGDSANKTVPLTCADSPPATRLPALSSSDSDTKVISKDPVHFLVGFLVGVFVAVVVICCIIHIRQRRRSGSKNISESNI